MKSSKVQWLSRISLLVQVVAVSDRHPPTLQMYHLEFGWVEIHRTFLKGVLGLCKQVILNLSCCIKGTNIHGMFGQQ